MMASLSILDIEELAEGYDVEAKQASGRDGQGELPKSFFESYSAMANTYGGVIFLGIEEKPKGKFSVTGIAAPERILKNLWDGLNNRQRISVNLLTDKAVEVIEVQSKQVIRIQVPRARRPQRPVYVGQNPLTGTYRRNYEGDYLCDEETVKRMLAEQVEEVRDARLLENYGFDDIDQNTLKAYRNQFKATKPDHPWLDLDDQEFLRSIGGWLRDRQTGKEGLTVAGLLMFGKLPSILEAVPHYVVDYQERPEPRTEARWVDRVTTDGTWSGNLYDFYRRVIQKLFSDLKVPFRLKGAKRVDETPVHEALREALINTLIHADYTGRIPIQIIKRPDMFVFRNPGIMRLPLEDALRGGTSDCRNRKLQKMFQLVGIGEQAGSGIPKIYRNWSQQHWRLPALLEEVEPDQTLLAMLMVNLLPEETLRELDERFGSEFRELSDDQRLALVTVALEGKVTHARLKCMSATHPHDLTKALSALVRDGFLESGGIARGTFYFFPGEPPDVEADLVAQNYKLVEKTSPEDFLSGLIPDKTFDDLQPSSDDLQPSSDNLQPSSDNLQPSSDDWKSLKAIAANVRNKGKVSTDIMEAIILKLCEGRFLNHKQLQELLGRSHHTLRLGYLSRMQKIGLLELRYPDKPTHPNQGYRTKQLT
ncbi:putative DNA binding domain-containing protein [Chlorogloeopsis sp. ULAP01]|uniref:RNA-binding domain-containing protein n=1 Tax=Chlorogloeopsis sp. ULAP01 TaxID=3056483 RepID=UPI0025AB22D9|nr:RNA-binding domain-containing protein [Chlorogloeopsis sp. ULAP01]MDM9383376.1 putative DNA binding domain-containing protein [Chlorogloeopsis sp. ULAP01]